MLSCLPPVPPRHRTGPSCVLCRATATIYCKNDDAFFCSGCDLQVHGSSPLMSQHDRVPTLAARLEGSGGSSAGTVQLLPPDCGSLPAAHAAGVLRHGTSAGPAGLSSSGPAAAPQPLLPFSSAANGAYRQASCLHSSASMATSAQASAFWFDPRQQRQPSLPQPQPQPPPPQPLQEQEQAQAPPNPLQQQFQELWSAASSALQREPAPTVQTEPEPAPVPAKAALASGGWAQLHHPPVPAAGPPSTCMDPELMECLLGLGADPLAPLDFGFDLSQIQDTAPSAPITCRQPHEATGPSMSLASASSHSSSAADNTGSGSAAAASAGVGSEQVQELQDNTPTSAAAAAAANGASKWVSFQLAPNQQQQQQQQQWKQQAVAMEEELLPLPLPLLPPLVVHQRLQPALDGQRPLVAGSRRQAQQAHAQDEAGAARRDPSRLARFGGVVVTTGMGAPAAAMAAAAAAAAAAGGGKMPAPSRSSTTNPPAFPQNTQLQVQVQVQLPMPGMAAAGGGASFAAPAPQPSLPAAPVLVRNGVGSAAVITGTAAAADALLKTAIKAEPGASSAAPAGSGGNKRRAGDAGTPRSPRGTAAAGRMAPTRRPALHSTGDALPHVASASHAVGSRGTGTEGGTSAAAPLPLAIPPYRDDETRADKLARYRAKKARRRFHKTVRYECRKHYADLRPRIKGRFVSPEEFAAWQQAQGMAAPATAPAVVAAPGAARAAC